MSIRYNDYGQFREWGESRCLVWFMLGDPIAWPTLYIITHENNVQFQLHCNLYEFIDYITYFHF